MNKEQLQKIAAAVGAEFLDTPATLTFKDGTTWDDVWAMGREMGDMFFLRGNGTIWQLTEVYLTAMKDENFAVDSDSAVLSVQEFSMDYVERSHE